MEYNIRLERFYKEFYKEIEQWKIDLVNEHCPIVERCKNAFIEGWTENAEADGREPATYDEMVNRFYKMQYRIATLRKSADFFILEFIKQRKNEYKN